MILDPALRTPWERSAGASLPMGFLLTIGYAGIRPLVFLRKLAERCDVGLRHPALFLVFGAITLLASLVQLDIANRWATVSRYDLTVPFTATLRHGPSPVLTSYGLATICAFLASALAGDALLQLLARQRCRLMSGLSGLCLICIGLLFIIILTHAVEPLSALFAGPRILRLSRRYVMPVYGAAMLAALALRLGRTGWRRAFGVFVLGIGVFYLSYTLVSRHVQSLSLRFLDN